MTKKRAMKIAAMCMAATLAGTTGYTFYPRTAYAVETKQDDVEEDEQMLTDTIIDNDNADDEEIDKSETVYVIANADGSVKETIVSEWLKNPEGKDKLEDKSDLKDIENVKGSETFTQSGNDVTWDAKGKDIYYQGKTDKKLPVDVKVSYTLDGKSVTPEEIAGKSGHATIRFDYANNEKTTMKVDDKEYEVYVPFMMMSGMILDEDKFQNVKVTNGRVISEGERTIVIGTAMPGLEESLKLSNKLSDKLDLDIPKYVEVSADVTDFQLDMTITAAMTDMLSTVKIDDEKKEDGKSMLDSLDDLDDLDDKLGDLEDASGKLVDGSSKLTDGVKSLDDGAKTLGSGVDKLYEGSSTLTKAYEGKNGAVKGAKKLAKGASDLSSGAKKLDKGVGSLKSGSKSLAAGASKLDKGVSSAESGAKDLQTGLGTLSKGASDLETGLGDINTGASGLETGLKDIDSGAKGLETGLDTINKGAASLSAGLNTAVSSNETINGGAEALDQGVDALKEAMTATIADLKAKKSQYEQAGAAKAEAAKTEADPDKRAELIAEANQAGGAAAALGAVIKGMEEQDLAKNLKALSDGSENLKNGVAAYTAGVKDAATGAASLATGTASAYEGAKKLSAGTNSAYAGSKALSEGAKSAYEGSKALSEGASSAYTGSGSLVTGLGELKSGSSTLSTGAAKLDKGVKQLRSGSNALSTGAGALSKGAKALSGGVGKLYDGSKTISTNLGKVSTGVKDLLTGTSKLYEGSKTLSEGMDKFDKEGIKKLTGKVHDALNDMDDYDISGLADRTKATIDAGKDYGIFTDAADDAKTSVKFIYKTASIESDKKKSE